MLMKLVSNRSSWHFCNNLFYVMFHTDFAETEERSWCTCGKNIKFWLTTLLEIFLVEFHKIFGFGLRKNQNRLWDYENHKIIRIRDVIFNEKVMYKEQLQGKIQEKEKPEYNVLDEIIEKEIPKVPKNQNVEQQE
jgi:hypothetical protein